MDDIGEIAKKVKTYEDGLEALRTIKPDDAQRLWRKFRLEWNYNSNHIEGNTLTYGETELLLIFDKTQGDHSKREYDEMQAHDVAIKMVQELANDLERPLTESFIRKLNEIILVKPYWKEAVTPDGQNTRREIKIGVYKSFPNSVRLANGEMFHYAKPEETPALMNDLMQWYNDNKHLTAVEIAAQLHYRFVRIHPFDDGNGRVARLLMNYVLLKAGYPPVIIKSKDKANYLTALNKADTGDLASFVKYIAEQLAWSCEITIKAAKGESIDEEGDLDKEISLLKTELKKDDVLKTPATVNEIVDAISGNVFSLFIMIENKCKPLKEYFFDFERKGMYQTKGVSSDLSFANNDSDWDKLRNEWLLNQIKPYAKIITRVNYEYTLKGFKKHIQARNVSVALDVYFKTYNYEIHLKSNPVKVITVPYGKLFSDEELSDIYTPLMKDVLEDIRKLNR